MTWAFIGFSFGFVEPGATVSVYLHGFPTDQFAGVDVQAGRSPSRPGAFTPIVAVDAHTVGLDADGTNFHTIQVTNNSVSNGAPPTPVVSVAVLLQPLQ
jgi:hypothetical protein